jgi:hypothetical protein
MTTTCLQIRIYTSDTETQAFVTTMGGLIFCSICAQWLFVPPVYRSFATRVSQLKIWHFLVIGLERNFCRCTFNRCSALRSLQNSPLGSSCVVVALIENYGTSKPLKVSPEKSNILSCDIVVANERYVITLSRFPSYLHSHSFQTVRVFLENKREAALSRILASLRHRKNKLEMLKCAVLLVIRWLKRPWSEL